VPYSASKSIKALSEKPKAKPVR